MPPLVQVLVMLSNPSDYPSWPDQRKVAWHERVMEWHEYIARLHETGLVNHAWGSHQLLSRAEFSASQGLLLAVYTVDSWIAFSKHLADDPMRDIARYVTVPLTPWFDDLESDTARFEEGRKRLEATRDSGLGQTAFSAYRSLFRSAPDFPEEPYKDPGNPPTDFELRAHPDDPLDILLLGVNPDTLITSWDDTRKFIHWEKVQWWHRYTAYMVNAGKATHVWGTHDFCHIDHVSGNSAAAVTIFRVKNYHEFDDIYKLDPIRDATMFWSVLLRPIADQRAFDAARLEVMRKRYQ